jgi:hypothetical protein
MLGSLFLSAALAWLTCCDNPQVVEPSLQAVYFMGCEASCDKPAVDGCACDEEMCGTLSVTFPTKPPSNVAVEFRLIRFPAGLIGAEFSQAQLLNSAQTQVFLNAYKNEPEITLLASPKMVLCSGQLGTLNLGSRPQTSAPACCNPPKLEPIAFDQNYRVSVGHGLRLVVPLLGPVPVALDFELPAGTPTTPSTSTIPARCTETAEFKATPVVSADGRYVQLELEGTTSCCARGQRESKNQTCTARARVVCADGSTIVLSALKCVQIPLLSEMPIIGDLFHASSEAPRPVVMMATVHVLKDDNGPSQTSCARSSQEVVAPTACCANSECCATVESNLAKLQKAKELFDLALLYERLDLLEEAQKIHATVVEVCPGSSVACQAQRRYVELAAQSAAEFAEIRRQWEKIWFTNPPSHLTPERLASSGDCTSAREAEAVFGAKSTKEEKFLELRQVGMTVIAESRKRFDKGETDKALDMLREHIRKIDASGFEAEKIGLLKKQPMARLQMLTMLKQNQDFAMAQKRAAVGSLPVPPKHNQGAAGEEEADVPTKSKLDAILFSYRQACKEGNVNRARQLAIEALAMDPTCFGK